jgi:ElaB/YqjD/DUF883 family membrane-anchored ribosome-binding protein
LDGAKGIVSGAHLDEAGAKASAAASNLYKEGLDLLAGNEDLSQATEHLSAAIRKNPLAAVGIAFSAGLLLALLTRGEGRCWARLSRWRNRERRRRRGARPSWRRSEL